MSTITLARGSSDTNIRVDINSSEFGAGEVVILGGVTGSLIVDGAGNDALGDIVTFTGGVMDFSGSELDVLAESITVDGTATLTNLASASLVATSENNFAGSSSPDPIDLSAQVI